jgi:ESF2/ABP1 family protein
MAPENKNEFLDVSDSEEEQSQGYDSDEDLRKGGRSAKRRRVDESDAASDDDLDNDGAGAADDDDAEPEVDRALSTTKAKDSEKQKKKKQLSSADIELPDVTRTARKNLVDTDAAIKKSGVVYLSRVPPFMKPAKLRSLLEPYGKLNRIFLAPEDPTSHTRRVRAGGNKKRLYTEGWVEFLRKKDAKAACELLNAQIIGGKKSSYYHDDIWNLLYLKGFKWHNLTEQIASENAERTSRMRAEISKTTKENKEFVQNVERAKMLGGMQAKAKAKKRKAGDEAETDSSNVARTFKQIPIAQKARKNEEQPDHVTRVLSKIF